MDEIDERVRTRAKRATTRCVVRGKAERVTVREIRGGELGYHRAGESQIGFRQTLETPFSSLVYVRVREGTNPNKNKRTTFRLSVRFCRLGAVLLVIVGLCSLISHGRRAGESPTKEWRRLEKSSSGKISHYLLSAPTDSEPVRSQTLRTRDPPDWSASIRITASRLQVSVPTTRALSSLLPAFAASLATYRSLTSGSPWTGRPANNHVFSSRRLQNRHSDSPRTPSRDRQGAHRDH